MPNTILKYAELWLDGITFMVVVRPLVNFYYIYVENYMYGSYVYGG